MDFHGCHEIMKRKVFVHIHIPKCAGTSVQWYLRKNFKSSLGNTTALVHNAPYTSGEVSEIVTKRPDLNCLTGHKLSLDLPFDHETVDLIAFTWIRDPFEHFVSDYFYHRNGPHHIVPRAKSMSLDEYADWMISRADNAGGLNRQTRFLVGNDHNLDLVRRRVESGQLLLFPVQALSRSIRTLVEKFPEYFKDIDIKTKNISTRDQAPSDSLRQRLKPLMEKDYELLELARQTPLAESRAPSLWNRFRYAIGRH